MIRILIVDKTAGLRASHERHQAIAAQPDVELHVLGPWHWIENGREIVWNASDDCAYTPHRGMVFGKDYYARAGYYAGMVRALRESKPHVIQLLEEPWSVSALQVSALAPWLAPQAKLLFYTWENIYRPWTYPSRASFAYKQIDKFLHRQSSGAVCATEQAKDVLLKKGYSRPVDVISYGIPPFFFDAEPHCVENRSPITIGYIGRMLLMKGVDLLLQAAAKFDDVRLVLIGDGNDKERFQQEAESLSLSDRIEWHDSVDENAIPALMQTMDLFVLPSRTTGGWKEQLGRVAIEAMAMGVPVIGSSSGAIPEAIGDAGLIFDEDSAESLTDRIARLKNDVQWRRRLSEAGRERARQHFTWNHFAERLCGFYHNLVSGKHSS